MNIFESAAALRDRNIPFAFVSITKSVGSTPRSNAHMIVKEDGGTIGTVGGGIAEFTVIKRAVAAIAERKSTHVDVSLTVTDGHACGGTLEFFIDVIASKRRLLLFGGGHVNEQIARLGAGCGFRIEVIETRAEYATKERFPDAGAFHVGETVEEAMKDLPIDRECAVIIATHGLDKSVLEAVITSDAAYIGMLGSRTKVNTYRRALEEERQIGSEHLAHFYSPVGLDIGSETPQEIAIAVMAEVMMVLNDRSGQSLSGKAENLIVVRGAGDLATGVIVRLAKAGYRVCVLEIEQPTTIRRTVAFSEAVYTGEVTLESVVCRKVENDQEAKTLLDQGIVALMVDPSASVIERLRPFAVVDAIIAKKNLGTDKAMAPLVIALGPGFEAGVDCDYVIETKRGHDLGKVISKGCAEANTGIPGTIGGFAEERVLHSPGAGTFVARKKIGDMVKKGEKMAMVGTDEIVAPIDGVVRGMLHDGIVVPKNFKVADIDPRGIASYCETISDKARALGGSVLEVIDGMRAKAFRRIS
jgi:xanthine dehydrogenase accessory factor